MALGIAWFDPPVYLDHARIFRRLRFSLRIRFLCHFALMFSRALILNLKASVQVENRG